MSAIFSTTLLAISIVSCQKVNNENIQEDKKPESVKIEITSNKVSEGYIGNGVQFNLYEHCFDENSTWAKQYGLYMDEDMWAKTFERLKYMKLGLARTMISSKNFCYRGKGADGTPIIDNNHNLHIAEKWLNFCDDNDITVLWGEWGDAGIAPVTDRQWSKTVIDYSNYLINNRNHDCIKYFIGCNEPDGSWSTAIKGDFNKWKGGIKNIFSEITDLGINDKLQIAGPDACPGITGTTFIKKTSDNLKNEIGIWDIHIYPYPDQIRSGEYEQLIRQWHNILGPEKKLVIGEIGMKFKKGTPEYEENIKRAEEDPMGMTETDGSSNMFVYDMSYAIYIADLYIQCMRGGISGACSWIVCDAMKVSNGTMLNRWGLWNIFGGKMGFPKDENLRPWYYTLSLLSRYIPKGSDILEVTDPHKIGLRAVASKKGDDVTIAVVNNSNKEYDLTLSLSDLNLEGKTLTLYKVSEGTIPTDGNTLSLDGENIEISDYSDMSIRMPESSFYVLTTFNY